MTKDQIFRQIKGGNKWASQLDDVLITDACIRAVRDMQNETHCSRVSVSKTISTDVKQFDLSNGTTFILTSTDLGYDAAQVAVAIEVIFVDRIRIQQSDGTWERVYLVDRESLDQGFVSTDDQFNKVYAGIEYDKASMSLFSDVSLNGKTFELRVRYQLAWQDNLDSGLVFYTVPVEFHDRLLSGVRRYVYEKLYEIHGDERLLEMIDRFTNEWLLIDLPFVKAKVQQVKSKETIAVVTPFRVF